MHPKLEKTEIPFCNLRELRARISGKAILFFGAGHIAKKTKELLGEIRIEYILDNANDLWGETQLGAPVMQPIRERLSTDPNMHIVVTSTSFREISSQLTEQGLSPVSDFSVSPVLEDLKIVDQLENVEGELIFTSGMPPVDSATVGGGIYLMTIKGSDWSYKKMISGNVHGFTRVGDNFVAVDSERGIIEFDETFSVVNQGSLPIGLRPHGVSFCPKRLKYFVSCSYRDIVLVLDHDFSVLESIPISPKSESNSVPAHHINDCCVLGDSLYVSMFSKTGNWKNDVFDGAIVEYDIDTGKCLGSIKEDLWMPHNVSFVDGSLVVLESLPGKLRANNLQTIGKFPGFTRGLAFHQGLFFLGQSRNRNHSRNLGTSDNIAIDSGIIVFDPATKVSRFLQLPQRLSEIHALCIFERKAV